MIPAAKSPLFSTWFARDAARRIERSFTALRARGLSTLQHALDSGPVVVVTNHTAWWDPLMALVITARVLRCDAYALMDAKNLERLPFFAKVGAFGVDLSDRADGARAIRYAARLLDRPGRAVWVFPQGREVPITVRPLHFHPGAAQIARVARASRVVCGALRYEMGARPLPTAWLSFGDAISPPVDVQESCTLQTTMVTAELDRIERAIVDGTTAGFEALHETGQGALSSFAERALAWMTRPKPLAR